MTAVHRSPADEADPGSKASGSGRLGALDGLRGIAALIVVFHHTAYLSPSFSNAYSSSTTRPAVGTLLWWVTSTPLRVITAGPEAVSLFFVLSGLVLVLPVLRRREFDWFEYFPRRAVRLLLPVLAAVVLAAGIVLATHQVPKRGSNAWVDRMATPTLDLPTFVRNLDLLAGATQLDNPLWSLRWELLFSLLLPVFVGLGLLASRRWWIGALVAGVLLLVGAATYTPSLTYLPVFFLGTLVACCMEPLQTLADRVSARRGGHVLWALALVVSALMFICNRMVAPLMSETPLVLAFFGPFLTALGAVGLLVVVLHWRPAGAFTMSRPVAWLGRVSFSLYLVHVPILIGLTFLLGSWRLGALIGVPLSLLAAEGFSRWIEQPSHRLSKRVGKLFSSAMLGGTDAGVARRP